MATTVTRVNPPTMPDASTAGYSQISIAEPGRLAFVSGQVAWSVNGQPAPKTLLEQTKIVIGNLKAALTAVGATPHDLVALKIYVVDLTPERMEASMPLVVDFLEGARPSLTGIGVAGLAGPDLQVEIEMIVRVPS
ncbi:MAG: RidA family protein [Clostridia bacterium]|nr:RidA family protein [Deltaproteobacteria bacterium]